MVIENKKKLLRVKLLRPEIMAPDAAKQFEDEYNNLLQMNEELHNLRSQVRILEDTIKERENTFRTFDHLIELEFETTEKEAIKNEVCMAVINREDARYK